jgi:hypothetical protein
MSSPYHHKTIITTPLASEKSYTFLGYKQQFPIVSQRGTNSISKGNCQYPIGELLETAIHI